MPRSTLLVVGAAAFAAAAFAAIASSQDQAHPARNQPTLDATPVDHMTWEGHFDLVQEIQRRLTEAKEAELARVRAGGDEAPSIAYLRAIRAIWEDDRLREAPRIVDVGKDILGFHASRHDTQRMLDASVEVLAVIDANRERWLALADSDYLHKHMVSRIDINTTTILSGMQSGSRHGRPHLELAALDRLIAMESDANVRENLIEQRDDLRERMAAGAFGPEEQK